MKEQNQENATDDARATEDQGGQVNETANETESENTADFI